MARLAAERVRLALRVPLPTAWGELRERELVQVRVEWPGGEIGRGEAAPLEPYDGVPVSAVLAALEAYAEVVASADEDADLLASCRVADPLPQALAAVDLALWDRAGRRAGKPVAALLAPDAVPAVAVNATIGALAAADAGAATRAAVRAGFGCVKVKVGAGDDVARVAAVREAGGPELAIRLDANGAWTTDDAPARLRALAAFEVEYVEEPVHGVAELAALRAAAIVPVAMDETAALPGAVGAGAADAVCLKIARCGGITGLLRDAAAARAAGSAVYVASSFDGPLGIAAGIHAAAALGAIPACGLATLGAFAGFDGVLAPSGGRIAVPAGPGLLGDAECALIGPGGR